MERDLKEVTGNLLIPYFTNLQTAKTKSLTIYFLCREFVKPQIYFLELLTFLSKTKLADLFR